MPTEMDDLLPTGTLYLRNEDGTMTPLIGLTELILSGCTKGSLQFVEEIPVVREMTFTMNVKRPARRRPKLRSMKSFTRPIKRIKRLKEKHRRYNLKNGTNKKIYGGSSQ